MASSPQTEKLTSGNGNMLQGAQGERTGHGAGPHWEGGNATVVESAEQLDSQADCAVLRHQSQLAWARW